MSRRIVVTGLGAVCPIGNDVPTVWSGLCEGKSGIGPLTSFDASSYSTRIAGEVNGLDFSRYFDAKEVRRTDKYILFAVAAADEAIRDSGLDFSTVDPSRCGTIIGSGIGGILSLEREVEVLLKRGPRKVSPFLIPMMIPDMASGIVSIKYNLKGPNFACVSACASGSHALGEALLGLKAGMMDIAVVGGAEAPITPVGVAGFCSMKALSTRNDEPQKASCPFDKKRDGFVIAEGAGVVVLETLEHALARNAKIYAEFIGYGATGDAYHLSAPAPDGEGVKRAMEMALHTAQVKPQDIDYINAHGTSTLQNDKNESQAIIKAFGEHARSISISSSKSMIGHMLGASGAVEFIATVLAVKNDIVPPTINYEDPDPECPLDYTPNKAVEKTLIFAMSNSFGFGGHNASVVIKKYEPFQ